MVRTWLKMTMAKPPAAGSAVPSKPVITVSVVVRATWASWVRISGTARHRVVLLHAIKLSIG